LEREKSEAAARQFLSEDERELLTDREALIAAGKDDPPASEYYEASWKLQVLSRDQLHVWRETGAQILSAVELEAMIPKPVTFGVRAMTVAETLRACRQRKFAANGEVV
jgi:hypothetical protein